MSAPNEQVRTPARVSRRCVDSTHNVWSKSSEKVTPIRGLGFREVTKV